MRWLINYIRQCFCKHQFKEKSYSLFKRGETLVVEEVGKMVFLTCIKCGYRKEKKIDYNRKER